MDLSVKLEGDAINNAITAAVLRALDDKTRDVLIGGAINYLLQKPLNQYEKRSALEVAFGEAVRKAATERCQELVAKSPEVQAAIDGLILEAVKKVTADADYRGGLVDRLADKIAEAITPDKYR